MLGSKTFLRNENFSRNCTTSNGNIFRIKKSHISLRGVFFRHPVDMTSESLTLGTHSLDLSLNNSFAKDPRMLRCGKEELGQVTRVGWCEPTPYNNSTDPGQAALANTTLGPASTLASDLHRLITVAHPQERPLGLVGSKRDEFVQRQQNQALAEDIC